MLFYQQFYYQLYHQLLLLFLKCSFWSSFYCICHIFIAYICTHFFLQKTKIHGSKIQISWFYWMSHFYIFHLITIVKFILSSISNSWLFWSVNHTLILSYSELNVFKKIWFVEEISNKLPSGLFGTNVYKTLESCW